jgi:hypothetical protein
VRFAKYQFENLALLLKSSVYGQSISNNISARMFDNAKSCVSNMVCAIWTVCGIFHAGLKAIGYTADFRIVFVNFASNLKDIRYSRLQ